jgi:pyruvate ferredoxin oxidoreductase delta subunit
MKYNIGAYIDEPGSSTRRKTGGWKERKPVRDLKKCTRCGVCWVFCPEGAIRKEKSGIFVVDESFCKGCGICANECPFKAITMVEIEK